MTTAGFAAARRPINDDKAEAHDHKQDAYRSKTDGLEERRSDWVKESYKGTGNREIIVCRLDAYFSDSVTIFTVIPIENQKKVLARDFAFNKDESIF